MRYGMVIDKQRCVGCDACAIACKQENGTGPGVFWSEVLKEEVGTYPNAHQEFTPTLCNHCEAAPCAEVCPTEATYIREDGIVAVNAEDCIGCQSCIQACPYNVRTLITDTTVGYYGEMGLAANETLAYANHTPNTVEKCTFCSHRVDAGKEPACVQACPAKARIFGDLDDAESTISKLIVEKSPLGLQEELETQPKVYYVM